VHIFSIKFVYNLGANEIVSVFIGYDLGNSVRNFVEKGISITGSITQIIGKKLIFSLQLNIILFNIH